MHTIKGLSTTISKMSNIMDMDLDSDFDIDDEINKDMLKMATTTASKMVVSPASITSSAKVAETITSKRNAGSSAHAISQSQAKVTEIINSKKEVESFAHSSIPSASCNQIISSTSAVTETTTSVPFFANYTSINQAQLPTFAQYLPTTLNHIVFPNETKMTATTTSARPSTHLIPSSQTRAKMATTITSASHAEPALVQQNQATTFAKYQFSVPSNQQSIASSINSQANPNVSEDYNNIHTANYTSQRPRNIRADSNTHTANYTSQRPRGTRAGAYIQQQRFMRFLYRLSSAHYNWGPREKKPEQPKPEHPEPEWKKQKFGRFF